MHRTKLAVLTALLLFSAFSSFAQPVVSGCQPYNTIPQAAPCSAPPTTMTGGTIAVTNTFQLILAAGSSLTSTTQPRSACVVQNNGSNNMWVYFLKTGGTAASKAASIVLQPGQFLYCQNAAGQVLQDAIYITGTSTDTYVVSVQ